MQSLEEVLDGGPAGDVQVIAACDAETGRILALSLPNHPDGQEWRKAYRVCVFKTMRLEDAMDQMDSEPRAS